ncbi:MAG: dihydrofolate reductase [Gammaproteobacteria bacterium]|nr:dihydrofolate reductase [Gammaproteobacteria bacterium]
MTEIVLAVAMTPQRVIGVDGNLPWHLGDDLRHFKALTMGKPVIMGRKTFESIGRPLPGRRNVVVTRNRGFVPPEGVWVAHSYEEAIELVSDAPEVHVIGGGELYAMALPTANRIELTLVHADVAGDTRFPEIDAGQWLETARTAHAADANNDHAFDFVTLVRR